MLVLGSTGAIGTAFTSLELPGNKLALIHIPALMNNAAAMINFFILNILRSFI
jgi:hypothetical protein